MRTEFTINGRLCHADVPPLKTLLAVLREDIGLTGSKEGCGEGECGACSVIMDGRLVNSCLVPALQASGSEILTVEGLGTSHNMDLLQRAFVSEGAVQCGFCTPGMIMAARALLEENPCPEEDEIKLALSGNICRCTGYARIYQAVRRAVDDGYCATFTRRDNLCSGSLPEPQAEDGVKCLIPTDMGEAAEMLNENPGAAILSGMTDIVPDMRNGRFTARTLLDLSRVRELKGIYKANDAIHIGACATNGDIVRSAIINKYLPALCDASSRSGAPAVQNRATVGGNLATASGAADLPSILLPLDASVVVESVDGVREMKLEQFIRGYRDPDLAANEIMKEVIVPVPKAGSVQKFCKRGSRKALTLSRISLGFYAEVESKVIWEFRAAAGSMSPIPIRLPELEAAVRGRRLTPELAKEAAKAVYNEVSPRKSPEWRKTMAANLTRRFIEELSA